jgi:hypothetical protein
LAICPASAEPAAAAAAAAAHLVTAQAKHVVACFLQQLLTLWPRQQRNLLHHLDLVRGRDGQVLISTCCCGASTGLQRFQTLPDSCFMGLAGLWQVP